MPGPYYHTIGYAVEVPFPARHSGALSNATTHGPDKRRGTGRVFPTAFAPPSASSSPTQVFPAKRTNAGLMRYIHHNNPGKVLISADGACFSNGQDHPRAGWAFILGPDYGRQHEPNEVAGRLENKGPWGDSSVQTNNRAELRAVIGALRFRDWTEEGFNTVVIATDSEYVARGATEWASNWFKNGWRAYNGQTVKNRDLWEMLLGEVERCYDRGLLVQFWPIPREWNGEADAAAKRAARDWSDIIGV